MKLQHELAKILEDELGKEFDREINEPDYKPQHMYADCNDRASDLLSGAFERVTKTLTLAIIEHRESAHEEDREIERKVVESQLNEEEIEISTRGWWID